MGRLVLQTALDMSWFVMVKSIVCLMTLFYNVYCDVILLLHVLLSQCIFGFMLKWWFFEIIVIVLLVFVDSLVPEMMPKDCIHDVTAYIQLCFKGRLEVYISILFVVVLWST